MFTKENYNDFIVRIKEQEKLLFSIENERDVIIDKLHEDISNEELKLELNILTIKLIRNQETLIDMQDNLINKLSNHLFIK